MYSMKFTFAHNNLNVLDLDKSLAFYKEALDLTEVRRKDAEDGSFTLVYLGDYGLPCAQQVVAVVGDEREAVARV